MARRVQRSGMALNRLAGSFDLHEADAINGAVFMSLIRAAVALNSARSG